jgi:hypothetical protein
MSLTKYGKYISKEIIEQSKYPRITAPMVNYQGDRGGRDLTFQWSCITQPLVMDLEPETCDVDQFLLFASTSLEDPMDFQAEIELPLGEELQRQSISQPSFVYVPAGLPHGPINFKSVRRPTALWRYTLDTKYSENWRAPDPSGYVTRPRSGGLGGTALTEEMAAGTAGPNGQPTVTVSEAGGVPFRYIKIPRTPNLSCWCKPLGIQAQLCMGYFVIKNRDFCCYEPIHYHQKFDEWLIFLGGDPLNVEEFDAEIEMFWGREQEKQVIDSTCVAHVPPGLVHIGQEHRRVGRPFFESITCAGTGDYFAEVEKVVLSREECGEPMIAEGSPDWVPVTRE